MATEDQQELLATSVGNGAVAAPASGATITLWSSDGNANIPTQAARYKKLIINLYVSHLSAASGLQVDESNDGGTTWRNLASYSIAATTYTKTYQTVSAPHVRVRYVNSANTLSTWELSVLGDQSDRAVG